MPIFEFREIPDSRQIQARIFPGPASEISAFKLRKEWESSAFNGCFVFEEAIDPAIVAVMGTLAQQSRDTPSPESETPTEPAEQLPLGEFVIGERRDASCTVSIAEDKMSAVASIVTACGGTALDRSLVDKAIEEAGVRFGTDETEIQALLTEAADCPPGRLLQRTVAKGTSPGTGVPSRFEYLVTPFEDRVLKPQEHSDGSIDLYDLGDIASVSIGTALLRRHPARPGPDGTDVCGESKQNEAPAELEFCIGEGAELDPEDPHVLRAARAGVPHRVKNGVSVNDVLQVEAVDLHTGNIEFEGSLIVKGDVRPGLRVSVGKDLIVGGFIESAEVSAGGDVTARQGIMGPPTLGAIQTCIVKARNITANYAQNAQLEASEDIHLTSHFLNCEVRFCRSLYVGDERQRKSRLAGGTIHASLLVASGVIGAPSESSTRIHLDAGLRLLRDQIAEAAPKHAEILQTLKTLRDTATKLQALPKSAATADKLMRMTNTIDKYQQELEQMEAQSEQAKQEIAAGVAACRVVARDHIYPGVELHCLDVHYRMSGERGAGTLAVRDGNWSSVEE